jgi:hypothetical protein
VDGGVLSFQQPSSVVSIPTHQSPQHRQANGLIAATSMANPPLMSVDIKQPARNAEINFAAHRLPGFDQPITATAKFQPLIQNESSDSEMRPFLMGREAQLIVANDHAQHAKNMPLLASLQQQQMQLQIQNQHQQLSLSMAPPVQLQSVPPVETMPPPVSKVSQPQSLSSSCTSSRPLEKQEATVANQAQRKVAKVDTSTGGCCFDAKIPTTKDVITLLDATVAKETMSDNQRAEQGATCVATTSDNNRIDGSVHLECSNKAVCITRNTNNKNSSSNSSSEGTLMATTSDSGIPHESATSKLRTKADYYLVDAFEF